MKEGVPYPAFWGEHIQPFLRCIIYMRDGWQWWGESSGIRSSGLSQHWEIVPSWISQVLWMAANPKDCTSVIWRPPLSSKSYWWNRYCFSFFRLSMASLLDKKSPEIITVHTSKTELCWFYDLMLEEAQTPCAYSLTLASGGGGVEVGRKSNRRNVERWKRIALCPFCLCNQHHSHPSPNTALISSPALPV